MALLRPLDSRGALISLLLSLLWGANPVAIKLGLGYAPPLRLACLRITVGGLAVLAYAWAIGRRDVWSVRPGQWHALWSIGILFAVQVSLMNMGLQRTTAGHASLLINTYAIHTVVLSHFLIAGDRLTASKLGGVLLAYTGIVVLFVPGFSFRSATLIGDLLVAVSALLLGERTVYMARAVQKLDPMTLLVYQAVIGGGCLLAASLWWEASIPTRYTLPLAASLFYQGAIVAGFNFAMNMYLLQTYRPSALVTWSLTTPIFGVLVAAVASRDGVGPTLLVATLLVAAGIGLTTRR